MKNDFTIVPMSLDDQVEVQKLLAFCDKEIGKGYYGINDLQKILLNSKQAGLNASLLAYTAAPEKRIIGARFSPAPGKWKDEKKTQNFTPELWPVPPESVAYFKSVFVAPEFQKSGLGSLMSSQSIEIIKKMNGKGIVCHASMNSPNNSSIKYLTKLGFFPIKEHEFFWSSIDYDCTHCLVNPCECKAMEMFKNLT